MPCMGPDLNLARKQGREVGEKLLAQLIKDHHLLEISDPKYDGIFRLPGSVKRWDEAKESFLKSVEELFVEDACNGF